MTVIYMNEIGRDDLETELTILKNERDFLIDRRDVFSSIKEGEIVERLNSQISEFTQMVQALERELAEDRER